jgi:hypothetical protein
MKGKRFTDEQITYALRQAEGGTPVVDVCRQLRGDHGRAPVGAVVDQLEQVFATVRLERLQREVVEHQHGWIGEATIAAAILDRLLHPAHRTRWVACAYSTRW